MAECGTEILKQFLTFKMFLCCLDLFLYSFDIYFHVISLHLTETVVAKVSKSIIRLYICYTLSLNIPYNFRNQSHCFTAVILRKITKQLFANKLQNRCFDNFAAFLAQSNATGL